MTDAISSSSRPAPAVRETRVAVPEHAARGNEFSQLIDTQSDIRAFGFGEFGLFGLHAGRHGEENTHVAPAGDLPSLTDDAESGQGTPLNRAANPLPSAQIGAAEAAQAPPNTTLNNAALNVADRSQPVPTALRLAAVPRSPVPIAMHSDGPVSAAEPETQVRTRPIGRAPEPTPFSIALDDATRGISISLFANGSGDALRERLRRRIASIAAEYGMNITELRIDGHSLPTTPPLQRN